LLAKPHFGQSEQIPESLPFHHQRKCKSHKELHEESSEGKLLDSLYFDWRKKMNFVNGVQRTLGRMHERKKAQKQNKKSTMKNEKRVRLSFGIEEDSRVAEWK
jgi:hypothetical protein